MRYVIRKVPERDTSYLEALLPDAEIYNDHDYVKPLLSFIEALRMRAGSAIYFQDDVVLCTGFLEKSAKEIEQRVNDVILFSEIYFAGRATIASGYCDPIKNNWMYAIYIPEWVRDATLRIWDNSELIPTKWEIKNGSDDTWFGRVMQYIGIQPYMIVPNLAGHTKAESVANKKWDKEYRLSPTFDYENCENRGIDLTKEIKWLHKNNDRIWGKR